MRVSELDSGRCAMLTVVAHKVPHGAVPVDPLYVKDDGTKVTSFAPCLKHFSGGFECGTRAHELGFGSLAMHGGRVSSEQLVARFRACPEPHLFKQLLKQVAKQQRKVWILDASLAEG